MTPSDVLVALLERLVEAGVYVRAPRASQARKAEAGIQRMQAAGFSFDSVQAINIVAFNLGGVVIDPDLGRVLDNCTRKFQ